jgi:glutamate/aspartate transport system substrate-binding protein
MKHATISLVMALSSAFIGVASAQQTDTLTKIRESKSITIGARDSQAPFSYKTTGISDPIGYTNDICLKVVEAVKKKLNMQALEVRYIMMNSANRIPLIQNGTADLDCASTTNTVARQEQVEFAPSHFVTSITVAVRKDSNIKSFADLKGKSVAAVTGSTGVQLLRAYRKTEAIEVDQLSGKDTTDAFLTFTTGRAAAIILDDVQLAALIANSRTPNEYVILKESLREEPYGIMYRKNDPQFKALVDSTLVELMKSGEISKIYSKWFTSPIPPANVNLNFPMTEAIKEIFKNPNNKGV